MMSRHFRLSSELSGAIAKRLLHAKNQLSVLGSFFNQFVTAKILQIWSIIAFYILMQWHSIQNLDYGWQLPSAFKISCIVILPFITILKYSNVTFD